MNYIFDLDGTLVETTLLHARTFVQAFEEIGQKIDEKKAIELIGLSGIEIAEKLGAKDPKKLYERKVELFIERADEIQEIKGATKVLNELKNRNHTVCIATSSGKKMANVIFSKFNWPLDLVITAEDVVNGKPHPEMLEKIKLKFPGEAIMVGDTTYDLDMAKSAKIPAKILGINLSKLEDLL
ncbi:MAG: HAD-IA family hydrolase [Candidatus Altiarchaeota archaeon]|nr:HAD-IA family hydrolase [Candidatus Altiarchaeota archaeon]